MDRGIIAGLTFRGIRKLESNLKQVLGGLRNTILSNPARNIDVDRLEQEMVMKRLRSFNWADAGVPAKYRGVRLSLHPNAVTQDVMDFCLGKTEQKWLVVQGGNGTGKTETLCASMSERLVNGLTPGMYLSCRYQVCPMFAESRSFSSANSTWGLYKRLYDQQYLVIDEPMKGEDPVLERTVLRNIFAAGYDNGQRIAVAMNGTVGEFLQWMGEDIRSRFKELCKVVVLSGDDWRAQ